MANGLRSRCWCFTLNNYTAEELKYIKENDLKDFSYIIVGEEIGEQGTPHLQGYVEYPDAKSFATMKKLIPRAHIEKSKGTGKENKEYCSKEGKILRESGEIKSQGKRTDIDEIKEKINLGENKISTLIENASSFQAVRFAEVYLKYKELKRNWLPNVRWYWGAPRSGKTRLAHEVLQSPYMSTHGKWFEGYDAHENVIIDDLRRDYIIACGGFGSFMNRLDRYAHTVECKGSTRQFLAKEIIITTIYSPEDFMETFFPSEPPMQLLGRLSEIKEFKINEST